MQGLQSRDIQGLHSRDMQGLQQARDIQQGRDLGLQQQQQQGRDIQQGRDHELHNLHSVPNNLANYNLGSLSHLLPHSQVRTQVIDM